MADKEVDINLAKKIRPILLGWYTEIKYQFHYTSADDGHYKIHFNGQNPYGEPMDEIILHQDKVAETGLAIKSLQFPSFGCNWTYEQFLKKLREREDKLEALEEAEAEVERLKRELGE